MATNPLKASKRKSKEESKRKRREERAEAHEVVDAKEKIELRNIFETIGERTEKAKLKELKVIAKRLPKLKLVVDNFNDDVAHLVKFERTLRKQDNLSIKEAVDLYNFNVQKELKEAREQQRLQEEARQEAEEIARQESERIKRQRMEE